MYISIIIRAYNEEIYIAKLLESLVSQCCKYDFEIIVVDSESTDSTLAEVAKFPRVKVVHIQKKNFTYGYALNIGVACAHGDICVAISGHCIPVLNTWLEKLIQSYEDDLVGMTYGKQLPVPSSRTSEKIILENVYSDNHDRLNFNNANSSFRRCLWERFRFDPQLPGMEDLDFQNKVISAGYKCVYVPDAAVYHIHLECNAQVLMRFFREELAVIVINFEVDNNYFKLFRFFVCAICGDCMRILREGKLVTSIKGVVGYRISQYYGIYLARNINKAHSLSFRFHHLFIKLLTNNRISLKYVMDFYNKYR